MSQITPRRRARHHREPWSGSGPEEPPQNVPRQVEQDGEVRGSEVEGVAHVVEPLVEAVLGATQVRIELWDQSALGGNGEAGTLRVHSPDVLRSLIWAPNDLGVGRSFVFGDLDFDGDLFDILAALRPTGLTPRRKISALSNAVATARRLRIPMRPLPPPPEEAQPRGLRHSRSRDSTVISHHYDVGNDFYRLILGESMTYSCARFVDPSDTLEAAQEAKHELICRKLGLHERPGIRLLDVGCGWGSMAMHAAKHHGAEVVGITISSEQAEFGLERVRSAALDGQIEIRLQDYRELGDERFDAISSIGMFEHVGSSRMADYFGVLGQSLVPGGRLLNHAITSIGGSKLNGRTFMSRYVFPDGELIDVGDTALAMQAAGFEVRDVESLREHYGRTLRHWVANLQRNWDEAIELVGERRARVWLIYMAACALGFENGRIAVHQTLGVIAHGDGRADMPSTRRDWN